MGYALFTARQMTLQARVNSLNSQLMSLSNKQTAIANQISQNQNLSNMQSAYAQQQQASLFSQNLNGGMDYTQAFANYQAQMAQSSLTSTTNNVSIEALKAQESALDTQRQTLTTTLNAANEELNQVKSAQEKAIKNSTVKFSA